MPKLASEQYALWLGCPNGRGIEVALPVAKQLTGATYIDVFNWPGMVGILCGDNPKPIGFDEALDNMLKIATEVHDIYTHGVVIEQHDSCIEYDYYNERQKNAIIKAVKYIDEKLNTKESVKAHGKIPIYGVFVSRRKQNPGSEATVITSLTSK